MTEDNYFGSKSSNEDSEGFSHDKRNQQYVSYRKENVSQGHSKKYPGNRDAQRHHFKSRDPGEDDKMAVFSPKTKSHGHRTDSHIHKHEDPCDAEFDAKMAALSPIAKSHHHRTSNHIHKYKDLCNAELVAKNAELSPTAKSHGPRTRSPIHEQEDPCDAQFDAKMAALSPTAKSHRHRISSHVHKHEDPCDPEFDAKNATLSPIAKSHGHRTRSLIHEQEDPCDADFDDSSHDKRNQQYASSEKENVSSRHRRKSPGHRHSPRRRSKSRDDGEDDDSAVFTPIAQSHSHRTSSHIHKQEDPCDTGAMRDMHLDKIWRRSTLWRKSREQHRKEKEAATTIQSAWRGYQVRRDMSTLDEAATQIQAAFRGYQTRKELPLGLSGFSWISGEEVNKTIRDRIKSSSFPEPPLGLSGFSWISGEELNKKIRDRIKSSSFPEPPLGLCDCSWISGEELSKKMRDKSKSRSFPEPPLGLCDCSWISGEELSKKMRDKSKSSSSPEGLHYFEEFEVAPGVHVGRESICLPIGKQRSHPKSIEESVAALQPLLDMNSPQMGVLVPPILQQSLDDAATTIQAALSGHQTSPKAISGMLQGEQTLGKPYCSNLTIEKIVRKQLKSGRTLEQHEVREIIAQSSSFSVRNIPRVRNINILTIVKRMPASVSKKPGVSIRVSSPNAVVQGYQKDMCGGVQGLYTIKNRYSQRPSQIIIHVNLQNEKDVTSCP